MSRWIEVSLRADGESAEALAEALARFGHQGVSIEQADIPPDRWDESEIPRRKNCCCAPTSPMMINWKRQSESWRRRWGECG